MAMTDAVSANIIEAHGGRPEAAIAALMAAGLVDTAQATSLLRTLAGGKTLAVVCRPVCRRRGAAKIFFPPLITVTTAIALVYALEALLAALEAGADDLDVCGHDMETALSVVIQSRSGRYMEGTACERCTATVGAYLIPRWTS
jgi:hypothetical protein